MPQILTGTLGLSNLLKRSHPWMESEGYGLEIASTAIALGQVVVKTAGVWAAITAVPLDTDIVGVALDATKENATKTRILTKGEAIVSDAALIYFAGATSGDKTSVNALLEAKDIQVNPAV